MVVGGVVCSRNDIRADQYACYLIPAAALVPHDVQQRIVGNGPLRVGVNVSLQPRVTL